MKKLKTEAFGGEKASWIRGLQCFVDLYGCTTRGPIRASVWFEARACEGDIEAMHTKSRGAGGKARHLVPCCQKHHREAHDAGHRSLESKYGLNLTMAAELYELRWQLNGLPEPKHRDGDYPHDPDDFERCRKLLKLMPEWRARIGEMAIHGRVWAALAERWEEIERAFVEEVGDGPKFGAMATRTYGLMRSIIDPAERDDIAQEAAGQLTVFP